MLLHLAAVYSPPAENGLVYFSWKLKLWGDQRKCEEEYSWMNEIWWLVHIRRKLQMSYFWVLSNIWKAVLYNEVDLILVQGASFEILYRIVLPRLSCCFSPCHSVFFLFYITWHCFKMFVFLCGHVRLFPSCDSLSLFILFKRIDVFYVFNRGWTTWKKLSLRYPYGESLSNTQASRWENYLCIVSTNE